MTHLRAVDRCYPRSDAHIARSYARSHIAESELRQPHPAELDALIVPCPLGEACASFATYVRRQVDVMRIAAVTPIRLAFHNNRRSA